jgi:hypothetical protein
VTEQKEVLSDDYNYDIGGDHDNNDDDVGNGDAKLNKQSSIIICRKIFWEIKQKEVYSWKMTGVILFMIHASRYHLF